MMAVGKGLGPTVQNLIIPTDVHVIEFTLASARREKEGFKVYATCPNAGSKGYGIGVNDRGSIGLRG